MTNMIAMRLMKPLYFWVGDSPDRMEVCLTLLGVNERQLLYFLEGHRSLISSMHCFVDVIVTIVIYCPW